MRDYDEIISTLTEDEKIQLVLAKTSFTKELCDKIDDNLYSRNDNFLGLFTAVSYTHLTLPTNSLV